VVIDLVILGVVLLLAFLGARSGAARQVAHLVALAAGYFAARRLGPLLAPTLAHSLGTPLLLGAVVGTLLVFFVVLFSVRFALTSLLRWLLGARDEKERGVDRPLGFILGGLKAALVVYVVLSALTFAEEHVKVAGRHLGVSPKDSIAVGLARRYNLFEMTEFAPVHDLVRVLGATADPELSARLQEDPAFRALRKDPRFQRALQDPRLREAVARGDVQTLLRDDRVLQLIQDPVIAARLDAAARAADARREQLRR
jgi:membrane protein required for colicin V production